MMLERLRWLATTLPFRAIVACLILKGHLLAFEKLARERFDVETFEVERASEPRFLRDTDYVPVDWARLIVSRWDAQHYIELGLRGYEKCKSKTELGPDEYPDDEKRCQLNFFPTYGFIGAWVAARLGWGIDYGLFAVSLVSSFVLIMLWTSRVITSVVGVGTTYLALLLFNTFTTGFVLVTVQTEPIFLMLTMGTYYCFARRWLLAAALVAGASTAIRITGVPVGMAYSAALLLLTWREQPSRWVWGVRALYIVLSVSGVLILMAYFQYRFGDALIYAHAHGRQYHHQASIAPILHPDTRLIMQSIWGEPNDGVWLAAGLLWFGLGHRKALERFDAPSQVFLYLLYVGVVGVAMVGSADYAYGGISRYLLGAIPLFFAMAALLRNRPIVLGIWLYISIAHYWGGSLCYYVGPSEGVRIERCGYARHFTSN